MNSPCKNSIALHKCLLQILKYIFSGICFNEFNASQNQMKLFSTSKLFKKHEFVIRLATNLIIREQSIKYVRLGGGGGRSKSVRSLLNRPFSLYKSVQGGGLKIAKLRVHTLMDAPVVWMFNRILWTY